MTRSTSSCSAPTRTRRRWTTFLSSTTKRYFWPWSVPSARSATSSAPAVRPRGRRTRTNSPGKRGRGAEFGLGVGKDAADGDRPGGRRDRVVDEIDRPLVREPRLVGQPEEDRERL